ncbi:MAG: DUF4290 domain-containing protein [Paraprevotella sp.]|nr:DUF4290 domain-containing protein [Paraprevotella sp.]
MIYNTQRKKLPMPEYGRGIQEMVDYAVTLENREERQRCARTIVSIMGNMFPHLRDVPDFKHKLWDHLAIMADYKLDIDYPYEVMPKKNGNNKPAPMAYPMKKIRYRHYGALLETLIHRLAEMPEGEERDELTLLVAGQMKRSLGNWNKDAMDDEKVAMDLESYTHGAVHLDMTRFQTISDQCGKAVSGRMPSVLRNAPRKNKRKN